MERTANSLEVPICLGCVVAQADSRRLPSAVTRDRGQVGLVADKAALEQVSS
jgi:hypothetical protein